MKTRARVLLILPILLFTSTVVSPIVYSAEEKRVLSRNYVGLGVEVYAPLQGYPDENTTIRLRVEALEDVKNASVTLFVWSSKSEGSAPWGKSFSVLDLADFQNGTIKEETYNVTLPPDVDPGLTYGILFLEWSIYHTSSWEDQWDRASFRMTYVKNENYENLQTTHDSVLSDLQNTRTLMYTFLVTTVILAVSIVCFARKKAR